MFLASLVRVFQSLVHVTSVKYLVKFTVVFDIFFPDLSFILGCATADDKTSDWSRTSRILNQPPARCTGILLTFDGCY